MSSNPKSADDERAAFARGFRELMPLGPGVCAWGVVTGIAMQQSGLTLAQSLGMTFLAYAGTAQLAALPLIAAAAPVWVVAVTAAVVNLRFVIYSLALRKPFAREAARLRLVLGYLTGDIGFVRFMTLLENEPGYPHPARYFLGGAACNWLWWQAGSLAGILAAGVLPRDSGLEFAGSLAMLTLLVPLCSRAPALGGVLAAGTVAVAGHGWPLRLGLLAAIAAGVATAVLLEALAARRKGARA